MTTANSVALQKPLEEQESEQVLREKAALVELRRKPLLAWPTFGLLIITQIMIVAVWMACLNGHLSLWAGCLINIIAYYVQFTPAHDASHNAVSRIPWVNKWVFFQMMQTYLPGNSGKMLMVMHMQHHRFANEELDPDHGVACSFKNAAFLWFFWDFRYLFFYFKHKEYYPDLNINRIFFEMAMGYAIIGTVAWFFPLETLILWFIPSRGMVWLVCFVFMYLPHVPHVYTHRENPYQATLMREGWDRVMSVLMMYQNYHLAHHLYPTIPFYRYKKAWDARKDFHEAHNPAKVKPLALHPYNLDLPKG